MERTLRGSTRGRTGLEPLGGCCRAIGINTNPVWQFCRFPSTYNSFLYVPPTAGVINPPGTYPGLTYSGFGFNWLFDAGLGGPWRFGPFGVAPPAIVQFGTWCQNQHPAPPPPGAVDHDVLATIGAGSLFPRGRITRMVLEFWPVQGEIPFHPIPGGSNLQSFAVIRG